MATVYADPDHLGQERRVQRTLRTINGHGWRQRPAPLAEHIGLHKVFTWTCYMLHTSFILKR